jgi:hypothetical protein
MHAIARACLRALGLEHRDGRSRTGDADWLLFDRTTDNIGY